MADFNPAGQISQILGNTISNTQRQTSALNQLRAGAALKDAAAKAAHPRALEEIRERGRMQMLSNLASQGFTPRQSQQIMGFTPDDRAGSNLLFGSSIAKNVGGLPGMAKGGRYVDPKVSIRDFLSRGNPNFLKMIPGLTSAQQANPSLASTQVTRKKNVLTPTGVEVQTIQDKDQTKAPSLPSATKSIGRARVNDILKRGTSVGDPEKVYRGPKTGVRGSIYMQDGRYYIVDSKGNAEDVTDTLLKKKK